MVSLKFSIILLSLFSLAIITQAQDLTYLKYICPKNYAYYMPNSTYEANLNLILSSLSSNATRNNINGFYNVSAGQAPDVVYGMFLCRGDVSNSVCRNCVTFGTKDVLQRCQMEKAAVILYDECELRYSNRNFFSTVDQNFTLFMMQSPNNVTVEPDRFNQLVATTLNNISTRAASAASGAKKFAVQQANYTGDQKLYSLVQCTPDLSTSDCSRCLEGAISKLGDCCNRRQGGRVIFASCNFRYELYEFYNATAEVEAVPAPPPATPSPPPASGSKTSGKGKERTILKTVLGTSIPIVVLAFLTASCIIYFRRIRRKETDEEKNHRSFFQELRKSRGSTFAEGGYHLPRCAPSLLACAWQLWNEGNKAELIDPMLSDSCNAEEFSRYMHIGLLCVQEDASDRPTMSSVVLMLKSHNSFLPQPERPAFVGRFMDNLEATASNFSVNEMTLSDFDAR
ncbi:hypothetical protein DKX38_016910 [Salix brachista]|uniref:Gnk2-homologous domain-containing protein n=1 Tax=Salix brachista TaxID=2182728 RepID=A0A5N5KTU9_9ROSI|nr:hypothetical protein DKX38_016910 [Salix brachista]